MTREELQRYNRHIILQEIGLEGQNMLRKAKVLVVGAGGLGCPALQYLTAAGVGTIGIADFDVVSLSNLQRQMLFNLEDVDKPKVTVAQQRLQAMNSNVHFRLHEEGLLVENALAIITQYDLVVDCSDNFGTRYLVNDACVLLDKPWVFGAIYKFEGQVSVFNLPNTEGKRSATYRCLFPQIPQANEIPNCNEAGVLGVLPGIVGTLQANEALKIVLKIGEPLANRLWMIDALTLQSQSIKFKRVEERTQIDGLGIYEIVCNPVSNTLKKEISVQELNQWLKDKKSVQVIDVREEYERSICQITPSDWIPLSTLSQKAHLIAKDKPVVIYCHHGSRSLSAIRLLETQFHFSNLYNLMGGIDAWAEEIEGEMERY